MSQARRWIPGGAVFFAFFWLFGYLLHMPHPWLGALITTPIWCLLMSFVWRKDTHNQSR